MWILAAMLKELDIIYGWSEIGLLTVLKQLLVVPAQTTMCIEKLDSNVLRRPKEKFPKNLDGIS